MEDGLDLQHDEPLSSSRRSKKSHHQPKGILKNSNPHATYHKEKGNRKIDEIIENERPRAVHRHHGHHHGGRHHHGHGGEHRHHRHRHRSGSGDRGEEETKSSKSSRHTGSGSKDRKSSSRHHKHHKHSSSSSNRHHKSSSSSASTASSADSVNSVNSVNNSGGGGGADEQLLGGVLHDADDMSNIYDCPNVPPIPVLVVDNDSSMRKSKKCKSKSKTATSTVESSDSQQIEAAIDEALNFSKIEAELLVDHGQVGEDDEEPVVYDVPRSNPRRVEDAEEAIYVNDSFESKTTTRVQEDNYHSREEEVPNYDVPRKNLDPSQLSVRI